MNYFTDELGNKTEKEIENLCIQFIEMLRSLKEAGKINDKEYFEHIKLKEEYVEYLKNKREF